jgi:hypothetical protein
MRTEFPLARKTFSVLFALLGGVKGPPGFAPEDAGGICGGGGNFTVNHAFELIAEPTEFVTWQE